MKKTMVGILIMAALMLGASGEAQAQAGKTPPAATAAPAPAVQTVQAGQVKIGFINVQKAVTQSDRGKAAIDRLQTEVNQSKAKLDVKKKEIETLQKALTDNIDKWDPATKQAKANEIEAKRKAITREAEDYQEYYQKRENEQLKPIIESLNQVINELGKKEGYTVIFDYSGAILYINPATDLTDKIIKDFNNKK